MSSFDELKQELLKQYPSIKTLGWWDRLKARMYGRESETHLEVSTGTTTLGQGAVLVDYKGKTYLSYFGRLHK